MKNSNRPHSLSSFIFWESVLWFLIAFSLWIGMFFFSPLDRDYTSGELLDHTMAWSETGRLYSPLDSPPYRVMNYPPLYLGIVRLLSQTGLSFLQAGRWVNLMGFVLGLVAFARWLRREGCDRRGAFFVLALLGCSYPVLYSTGQFHLELLGIAFTLWGLYEVASSQQNGTVILGGMLCALACFVKQTQAISALITLLWLAKYHRRKLIPFTAGLILTAALGVLWIHLFFGPLAWKHLILYTIGSFSILQFLKQILFYFLPWILFTYLGFKLGLQRPERRKNLTWWYYVGSSLWLFSSARAGSGDQYFIEWSFATLLWIGPELSHWLRGTVGTILDEKKLISTLVIFQIFLSQAGVACAFFMNAKQIREMSASFPMICKEMPQNLKFVLVEEPILARLCGREPVLHPFIMTNLAQRGLWDESPLIEEIAKGSYPFLVLPFDPKDSSLGAHSERWTPRMIEAMAQHYRFSDQQGRWKIFQFNPHDFSY